MLTGFRAYRWIAWRLPATFRLAPLLWLPGVDWAGERVYRRVGTPGDSLRGAGSQDAVAGLRPSPRPRRPRRLGGDGAGKD